MNTATALLPVSGSELSLRLYDQVNKALQSPAAAGGCGVIVAKTKPVEGSHLQDLEARLRLEDSNLLTIAFYDSAESALVLLLPGQTLAFTHFLSLTAKAYLQGAGLLDGRIAVAGFPDPAAATEDALHDFVARWSEDSDGTQEIAVYAGKAVSQEAPKVVMIDSNADLLDFLNVRLGMKGYDVRPAQDGMEGLRLIESVHPDLVITELKLPALDGYQLIHRIRSSRKNAGCKVVVLTDLGVEQDICKCFELGAADVIRKPFSPAEFEARIRRLLA